MKPRILITLILAGAALAVTIAILGPSSQPTGPESESPEIALPSIPTETPPEPAITESVPPPPIAVAESEPSTTPKPVEQPIVSTNKLERLRQIREIFRTLAAGDPTTALRAAKQITDETERETALLTLVTEWKQGELGSSRRRAQLISDYGLEAGLGFELAKYPDLAILWANELTDGPGRVDLLQ